MMIIHPFEPLYNENSRILILGSFPSVKSRESNFYYGHPQNRFWKVTAAIFDADVPKTIEEKKSFLRGNGIALWDVIKSCEITGSSDSSIKNAVPNDIEALLRKTGIKRIFINGKTAGKLFNRFIGLEALTLPSTSPANAVFSLEKLIECWKEIR